MAASVIKVDGKFYPHVFLEEALHSNKHGNSMSRKNYSKKMFVSKKWWSEINFKRLEKALAYKIITDADNNMHLTVELLIDIYSIISSSNNITLKIVNVKPHGFEEIHMDKDLIEDKLYQLIDQLDERKTNRRYFSLALTDNIYPFHDGNGITCKILF